MKLHDAPLAPAGVVLADVHALRGGAVAAVPDWLAEEVPVALVANGIGQAVMMASPADLEDFALGFGLTEGWFRAPHELYGVDVQPGCDGIELHLEVASACAVRLRERRRSMAGRTGCGLCGTDSLAQVQRDLPSAPVVTVTPAAMARALRALRTHQALQQLTGATHAAAWCGLDGRIRHVREDIGRHNALDKLIGAIARAGHDPAQGFAIVTSRASYEMVLKLASVGGGLLAAISAPTGMAVDLAARTGVTLCGFVRGSQMVIYNNAATDSTRPQEID